MAGHSPKHRKFTREFGFTIIELMIVIAIISIILVIAVPVYQQYTTRAKITEGLNLAAPVLHNVAEYYQTNNKWPADNTAAGAPAAAEYETDFVKSIEVSGDDTGATITITYKPDALGDIGSEKTLIYTPSVDSSLTVQWACDGGTLADWARPSRCR